MVPAGSSPVVNSSGRSACNTVMRKNATFRTRNMTVGTDEVGLKLTK